jgi:hypothetical protein
MQNILRYFIVIFITFFIVACGESDDKNPDINTSKPSNQRSFYMGFTPWSYDATTEAVESTYSLIQDNGDIISHHLMEGIPWEEAYNETSLPETIEDEISSRINQTHLDKVIYLAIDSLNTQRDDLAPNWGDEGTQSRPSPWDTKEFDDPEVAEAYSNFALSMIDRFHPSYFNYAPEVSELILNDPIKFNQFVIFSQRVYNTIKKVYPDLPLMVSIALKSPTSTDTVTIKSNFSKISDYVDVVGISVYPYAFYEHNDKGDPANLPSDWISQISSITKGKALAITETAWIAEDLVISNLNYSVQSDTIKQKEYISTLLASAENLSMEFVIWFSIVDYDALWSGLLGEDDLSKLWKDTGLYDENKTARAAFDTWSQYYLKEKK